MKKSNIKIPKLLILSGVILIILFLGIKLELIEGNKNKINRVINDEPQFDIINSIFSQFNQQQQQQQKKKSSATGEPKRILLRNEIINTSIKKGIKSYSNTVSSKVSSNDKNLIDLPNLVQRVLQSTTNQDEEEALLDQLSNQEYHKKSHYLVQFAEKITRESKNELAEFLISTDSVVNFEEQPFPSQIIHYIPHDSFLVVMTFEQSRLLSTKKWISWVGELEASNKIHLNFHQKSIGHPVYTILCGSSESMFNKWQSTLNNLLKPLGSKVQLELINSKKIKSVVSCIGSNNNNQDSDDKCSLVDSEKLVYSWISEQPESNFIERVGKLLNSNRQAPSVIFAQNQTLVNNDRIDIPLRGQGQIISIADTGIDASHCFFSDSNNAIPYNTINLNHRKVIAYYYNSSYGDDQDYADGHGTHVCGSAVGSTQDSAWQINQYSGLASDAKLAFYDIGQGVTAGNPTPPSDFSIMYQQLYDTGARIHGDSWGSVSLQGYLGAYSDDAGSIDDFLYNHPDFIILRAAGNNEQYGSILSQASAKNAITVGAEQSTNQAYQDAVNFFDYEKESVKWRQYVVDNFDDKYASYTSDQCCSEMSTIKGLSKCCIATIKQAYIDTFSDTTYFNENNMASFSSRGPTHDGRLKPDIVAPGQYITSSRSNGPDTTPQCGTNGALPATDALLSLEGTSMATPLATAATAILRQYLMEGYYPTGEPVEENKLTPTGSLLKALMINNAQLLNGTFEFNDGEISTTYPKNGFEYPFQGANYVQGWGALRMSNWMYVKSTGRETNRWIGIGGLEKDAKFSEWKEPEVETNFNISYCFKFKPNNSSTGVPKIVATLVWTDPASYSGAKFNLVNNLDLSLSIHGEGETKYFVGNSGGASRNDTDQEYDSINNVETIIHYPTEETSYSFLVAGTNVPLGPQKFSFVFHGENGDFDWADECRQCSPEDPDVSCSVPNGSGSKSCKSNYEWSKCLVQSCNNGYNYNSLNQQCEKFLSYNYIIIIVAGGIMFIIICVLMFAKYREYKETKLEVVRRADDGTGIHIRNKEPLDPITIADLYSLISPFVIRLAFSTACSLVATAASILEPFYIGQIIQDVPTTKSINDLRTKFIIIFVLAFLEFVFSTISSWVSGIANEQILMRLQNKVFRSIMAQDIIFFQSNGAAALMNIIIIDTPMVRSALTGIMVSLATGVCKFVGSLVFIFTISWKLSLAFFGAVPVLGIVTQVQAQFTKRLTRVMLYYNSKASQLGQESFSNIHVVANYCKQEKEMYKYGELLMDVYLTSRKLIINNTFAGSIKWLMVESLAFVILYFGAFLVIQKQFTVGLLVSFSLYIGYVIESSTSLFGVYVSYIQCQASATRVFMILRSAPKRKATLDDERLPDDSNDSDDSDDDGDGSSDDSSEESSSNVDDYSRRYHRNHNKAFDTETDSDSDGFSYGDLHSSRLSARISMGEGGENNINQIDNASVGSNDQDESPEKKSKGNKKKSKSKSKSNKFTKNDGLTVVEMKPLANYMDYDNCRGDIELRNVTFIYPLRPDVKVLQNVSMKFEAGKCYGIVGPSGSGKSTILDLIARFYYVPRGDLFIDGQNIELIRPNVLRSFVTCVHQNALLFEQSIFDNIGYSLDKPTKEQVVEAAKLANAHEFIEELPEKYDTILNANGGLLSGGQKKRIAIARAIAAKRKIMLLDEITAELDPESEEAVTNSIKQLTKGHTVIMVAHKVAAVRDCDKIFVLEKGRLIEEGTHDELMSMKGKYHRMFRNDKEEDDVKLQILPTEEEIKEQQHQNHSIDSGDSISNSRNNNTINLNSSNNNNNNNNNTPENDQINQNNN